MIAEEFVIVIDRNSRDHLVRKKPNVLIGGLPRGVDPPTNTSDDQQQDDKESDGTLTLSSRGRSESHLETELETEPGSLDYVAVLDQRTVFLLTGVCPELVARGHLEFNQITEKLFSTISGKFGWLWLARPLDSSARRIGQLGFEPFENDLLVGFRVFAVDLRISADINFAGLRGSQDGATNGKEQGQCDRLHAEKDNWLMRGSRAFWTAVASEAPLSRRSPATAGRRRNTALGGHVDAE
jgi:hypothetical protein